MLKHGGWSNFLIFHNVMRTQRGFIGGALDGHQGSWSIQGPFPRHLWRREREWMGSRALNYYPLRQSEQGVWAEVGLSTPPSPPIPLSRVQIPQGWLCFGQTVWPFRHLQPTHILNDNCSLQKLRDKNAENVRAQGVSFPKTLRFA